MTKDRLAEIQIVRQTRGRGRSFDSDDGASERDKLLTPDNWDTVNKVMELSRRIQSDMDELEEKLNEVQKLHGKLLSVPSTPVLAAELNSKTEEFLKHLKRIRDEVVALNRDIDSNKDELATANNRIKRDQVSHLTRKLCQLSERFNTVQTDYKEKSKKKYTEYLRVLNKELPDDVIEEAIEEGTLYEKSVGIILTLDEKRALLDEVKQRTEDTACLEKSIRELAEMFHDLHLLVVSQGEMLNNIECNVGNAVEYAYKAKNDIVAAQKMKRRAQFMKIGLVICVILLVIIIFMIGKMLFCFYLPFLCT